MQEPNPPKPATKIIILTAVIGLALIGYFVFEYWGFLGIPFEQNSGSFDRKTFEAVVSKVRELKLSPGGEVQLRLDKISDPDSLRPLTPTELFPRGQGAGNVWATVSTSGILKVVIETKDLGHAGEFGFAFSDDPWVIGNNNNGQVLDVPGRLNLTQRSMKIDERWQEVSGED